MGYWIGRNVYTGEAGGTLVAGAFWGNVRGAIPGARACTSIVWRGAGRHAIDRAPSFELAYALGEGAAQITACNLTGSRRFLVLGEKAPLEMLGVDVMANLGRTALGLQDEDYPRKALRDGQEVSRGTRTGWSGNGRREKKLGSTIQSLITRLIFFRTHLSYVFRNIVCSRNSVLGDHLTGTTKGQPTFK